MVPITEQSTDGLPRAADPAAVERGFGRWQRLGEPLPAIGGDTHLERLLAGIFGNSPYLSESLLAEPAFLKTVLADGPDAALEALMAKRAADAPAPRTRLMTDLRRAKRRLALLVAIADIAGHWPLERITEALTRFADLAVGQTLDVVLREAAQRGEIELADSERPQEESGIVVLGMGKLGAFELNYSSDIDLIVLFEPERLGYRGREGPMAFAVRLTRTLVHMLEHRTRAALGELHVDPEAADGVGVPFDTHAQRRVVFHRLRDLVQQAVRLAQDGRLTEREEDLLIELDLLLGDDDLLVLRAPVIFGGTRNARAMILRRHEPVAEDPWGGYTLEWATASPPPAANFAIAPGPVASATPLLTAEELRA